MSDERICNSCNKPFEVEVGLNEGAMICRGCFFSGAAIATTPVFRAIKEQLTEAGCYNVHLYYAAGGIWWVLAQHAALDIFDEHYIWVGDAEDVLTWGGFFPEDDPEWAVDQWAISVLDHRQDDAVNPEGYNLHMEVDEEVYLATETSDYREIKGATRMVLQRWEDYCRRRLTTS